MKRFQHYLWIVFPLLLIVITTIGVVLDRSVRERAVATHYAGEQSVNRSIAGAIAENYRDYESSLRTLAEPATVPNRAALESGMRIIYRHTSLDRISAMERLLLSNLDGEWVYRLPDQTAVSTRRLHGSGQGYCAAGEAMARAFTEERTVVSRPFVQDDKVYLSINVPVDNTDFAGVLVGVVSLTAFTEQLITDGGPDCRRLLLDGDTRVIYGCRELDLLDEFFTAGDNGDDARLELLRLRIATGRPGVARVPSSLLAGYGGPHEDLVITFHPFGLGGEDFLLLSVSEWDEVLGPFTAAQRQHWLIFGGLVLLTVVLGLVLWRRQSRRLAEELDERLDRVRDERRRALDGLRSINRALTSGGELKEVLQPVSHNIAAALDLYAVQVLVVDEDDEGSTSTTERVFTCYNDDVPGARRILERLSRDTDGSDELYAHTVDKVRRLRGPAVLCADQSLSDGLEDVAEQLLHKLAEHGVIDAVVCPLFSSQTFEGAALLWSRRDDLPLEDYETFAIYLAQAVATSRSEHRRRRTLDELDEAYARLRDFQQIGAEILGEVDLVHICQRVVNAITNYSTFQRAVLSLMEDGVLHRFAFANIDEEDVQALLQAEAFTAEQLERIQAVAHRIGRCYYLPGELGLEVLGGLSVPSRVEADRFEDWSPDDFFFVPLVGQQGEFLGLISVDDPEDGRVPTAASIQPLESFASLAAQAIATARLQQRLQESRERYRALFSEASDALFVLDDDLRLTNVNKRFCELAGHTRAALLQVELTELVVEEQRDEIRRALERVHSGLGRQEVEFRLLTADGEERIVQLNIERKSSTGDPIGEASDSCQGSLHDVTATKRAEGEILRRQEQLKLINKLGRLALSSFDRKTLIKQTVEALYDSGAYDNVAVFLLDQDAGELVLEAIRGFYEVLISVGYSLYRDQGIVGWAATTGTTKYVGDVYDENRYIQPVEVFEVGSELCIPILIEGEAVGVLDFQSSRVDAFDSADISALETVADQLSQALHNINLYQELREKALALALANEELVKLDQMKSDFVSMVSHELNTPVTVIKGYAQLMFNRIIGDVNDKQLDLLGTIIEKSDHLTKLINELLDLLKLESGQYELELERTDVSKMLEDFFEHQEKYLDTPRMKLVLDLPKEPVILNVDKAKLHTIFYHLLSNANKFTIGEGSVTISAVEQDGHYQFTVADAGIGIPESEFERIFDRLYQVDSTLTRHYGGTGLGLAITRAIVNRHHGKVWVESELGVGSRFIFTMPKELTIKRDLWEDIE